MNPFNDEDASSEVNETDKQTPIVIASPPRKAFIADNANLRPNRRINRASANATPVGHHNHSQQDGAMNGNTTPIALMRRCEPSSPFLGKRNDHSPLSPRTWKKIGVKPQRPRYDDTPINMIGNQKFDGKSKDCVLDINDLETIPLHTTHLFRVPNVGFETNQEVTFTFTNKASDKKKKPTAEVKEPMPKLNFIAEPKQAANAGEKLGCNCRNSKCLKLYCECLRRGDYCDPSCNCHECENHHYSKVRETKIKDIEKKNPLAFKPLVAVKEVADVKAHHKGCNCKKSNCLKNYCECHQFGVMCTVNCKCVSCKNTADNVFEKSASKNTSGNIGVKNGAKAAKAL